LVKLGAPLIVQSFDEQGENPSLPASARDGDLAFQSGLLTAGTMPKGF
jgi:hypothetical protein